LGRVPATEHARGHEEVCGVCSSEEIQVWWCKR